MAGIELPQASAAESNQEKTGLGNYFIANYPPFSFWKSDFLADADRAMNSPPRPGVPLGLYLHIPFCRKRCKFCYFRVYTDKNAQDVANYTEAITREVELLAKLPVVGGRALDYVYFGGGTPSYLSSTQLRALMTRLREIMPWDSAREVTFECEPGTLQEHKLETLREMGVTRLSLGVENFKPEILKYNGRAHLEEEIHRAFGWARRIGFPQVNIDLISGMVGETWENWRECIAKTIDLAPDSVTIYQMELPFNTVFSKQARDNVTEEGDLPLAVADWPTKRAWVDYAFETFQENGYEISSAYTVVKKSNANKAFIYRDALWSGADMFGTGVASFGHLNGVHVQNVDTWEAYLAKIEAGEVPLGRAYPMKDHDLLVREFILQLKTGHIDPAYFQAKFGADVLAEFAVPLEQHSANGMIEVTPERITVSKPGMLVVDRLLPAFFEAKYLAARYT